MSLQLNDKRSMNNLDLENEGIWVEVDAGLKEAIGYYAELPETTEAMEEDFPVFFLKIRRYNSPKIRPRQRAIARRYNLNKQSHTEKMNIEVMSELIIADWSRVADEDGSPLECTPENVRKFIAKDEYKWMRDLVLSIGVTSQFYLEESLEDLGKSSARGSGTRSAGRTKKTS